MEKHVELSDSRRKDLETLIQKQGYTDYKWIDPDNIIVSQWVRIDNQF